MSSELVPIPRRDLARAGMESLPAAIGRAGEAAAWRFIEFLRGDHPEPQASQNSRVPALRQIPAQSRITEDRESSGVGGHAHAVTVGVDAQCARHNLDGYRRAGIASVCHRECPGSHRSGCGQNCGELRRAGVIQRGMRCDAVYDYSDVGSVEREWKAGSFACLRYRLAGIGETASEDSEHRWARCLHSGTPTLPKNSPNSVTCWATGNSAQKSPVRPKPQVQAIRRPLRVRRFALGSFRPPVPTKLASAALGCMHGRTANVRSRQICRHGHPPR